MDRNLFASESTRLPHPVKSAETAEQIAVQSLSDNASRTSKRKAKNIGKSKAAPGKAQERTYTSLKVPTLAVESRVEELTEDTVYRGVQYRKGDKILRGYAVPAVPVPSNMTIVGPYSPVHKPVLSACSMKEASYFARLLRRPNASAWIAGLQGQGLSTREHYAQSIGIDVRSLRAKGDVYRAFWGTGANFLNRRGYRKFVRSYNDELERKIAIAEFERTPEGRQQKLHCQVRLARKFENEQNRARNSAESDRRNKNARAAKYQARMAEQG